MLGECNIMYFAYFVELAFKIRMNNDMISQTDYFK